MNSHPFSSNYLTNLSSVEHILLIGNGISGVTLAIDIRKQSDLKITIISWGVKFFSSRTAPMYVFLSQMKFEYTKQYKNIFKKKNNINLTHKWVTEAFPKEKSLFMADNSSITFDKLVTATSYKLTNLIS